MAKVLHGDAGNYTFAFHYSATETLSAVIEDLNPSDEKIVVNFDGTARDEIWRVLKLTNDERENQNLPALTMSDGLTRAAQVNTPTKFNILLNLG